jgi:peroxiredoxin
MRSQTSMAFMLTIALGATMAGATPIPLQLQSAYAFVIKEIDDAIAASGNNVYVLWSSDKTGRWEVMIRVSNDNGKSFADKVNLSNTSKSNSFHSNVAVFGNDVYVSWLNNNTGYLETNTRTSTDGGKIFGPILVINGTGTLLQKSRIIQIPQVDEIADSEENTHIATSGDRVYIVSWDKKSGNWEILFARSTDGGKTFEKTINLSNSPDTRSDHATILVNENNVYMIWWETARNGTQDPVFRASDDNGSTFGPVLKLDANGAIGSRGRG